MECSRHHRRGRSAAPMCLSALVLVIASAVAQPSRAESPQAAASGAAVARVLAPAEKIKVLEEELAKENEKRMKLEDESRLRNKENSQLVESLKSVQKERSALDARLADAREREGQLQKINDRLREETERVTVSVRYAMPIIAGVTLILLAMMIWMLLFLRQVAARVHGQRTISEMHELEGRLIHTNELLSAELKRSSALRNKLAEMGVVD